MNDAEATCLSREWFYPFRLASGGVTKTYVSADVAKIHHTRAAMLDAALDMHFGAGSHSRKTAIDLACHEGWFAQHVARRGFEVVGVDARADHVADATLVAQACGITNARFRTADVHSLLPGRDGRHDLVLCLGLLYHLENPVGALRTARALTADGGLCVIETQIAPGLSGNLDYGHHTFVKPMQGSFAIVDESDETHGPETSTTGICLVPSLDALQWILRKVGFANIGVLAPPADAYEQLRFGKRVMVVAHD
jgi:tRNA (mo5U34)-methyltransferase